LLKDFPDIERIALKISSKTVTPRELKALKDGLKKVPLIINTLNKTEYPEMLNIANSLYSLYELIEKLEKALVENPPALINEGGIFRKGYNSEIDELRELATSAKDYIVKVEMEEKKKTGINSLKIGYNRVFGYYIEITKPNLHLVPSSYIRKQTLVNAERFITEELKNLEAKIIGAEEKLKILEQELYLQLIEDINPYVDKILFNAETIGYIDFILSLATVASKYNYTKPEITEDETIEIIEGRHPVIERFIQLGKLSEQRFIPNDLLIGQEDQKIIIITGPNMAGGIL
jgi:Mismatch repair ATPase (MutS family)